MSGCACVHMYVCTLFIILLYQLSHLFHLKQRLITFLWSYPAEGYFFPPLNYNKSKLEVFWTSRSWLMNSLIHLFKVRTHVLNILCTICMLAFFKGFFKKKLDSAHEKSQAVTLEVYEVSVVFPAFLCPERVCPGISITSVFYAFGTRTTMFHEILEFHFPKWNSLHIRVDVKTTQQRFGWWVTLRIDISECVVMASLFSAWNHLIQVLFTLTYSVSSPWCIGLSPRSQDNGACACKRCWEESLSVHWANYFWFKDRSNIQIDNVTSENWIL